ncbi:SixA phosphatase family protein [Nitratifractor sp.]
MKTLFLMRHAKSSWKEPLPDHERPLNRRGKKAAKKMGKWLKKVGRTPDLILCSDARRAVETARRVRKGLQRKNIPIRTNPTLYAADAQRIFDAIGTVEDTVGSVLIIAHNPGISEAAVRASGKEKFAWMPTAAIVGLRCEIDRWKEVGKRRPARTLFYCVPKSLEKKNAE